MLTVACVCVGDGFADEYVTNLQRAVERNLSLSHDFVCLSDRTIKGVDCRRVADHFKDWWAKMYLFSDYAFTPGDEVIYLDLDTVITGELDSLAALDTDFAMLSDFLNPKKLASGVMKFRAGECGDILYDWLSFGAPRMLQGDQMWINMKRPKSDRIQEKLPEYVISYKAGFLQNGLKPQNSIVCFHGKPRPHEVDDVMSRYWKGQIHDHSMQGL